MICCYEGTLAENMTYTAILKRLARKFPRPSCRLTCAQMQPALNHLLGNEVSK
jgi:hypothetical protein